MFFFFSRYLHVDRLFNLSTEKRRFAPLATLLRLASWRISWLLLSWLLVACNSVMPGRDHSRSHHFLSPKQQHALLSAQGAEYAGSLHHQNNIIRTIPSLLSNYKFSWHLTVMSRSNQKLDIAINGSSQINSHYHCIEPNGQCAVVSTTLSPRWSLPVKLQGKLAHASVGALEQRHTGRQAARQAALQASPGSLNWRLVAAGPGCWCWHNMQTSPDHFSSLLRPRTANTATLQ